jgi:hypothetical protein
LRGTQVKNATLALAAATAFGLRQQGLGRSRWCQVRLNLIPRLEGKDRTAEMP